MGTQDRKVSISIPFGSHIVMKKIDNPEARQSNMTEGKHLETRVNEKQVERSRVGLEKR